MALGDLAAIKVHWTNGLRGWETALGVQCISPFTNWRTLLAAEFVSQIIPDWRAGLSLFASLTEVRVTDVVPGTGADAVLAPTPLIRGAVTTGMAPINCAAVISWRSDGIGRNTRGRSYLGGMGIDEVSTLGGVWGSGVQAWQEELATVILAQYGPTGFSDLARLVVISRGPKEEPLEVPQAFPITRVVLPNEIRSQRRRVPS